ncbi:hypothetical protein GCM10007079_31050 [Nocardiopsis terrae]|nr:hypothetical protein GCM10007079_31050 [Nocardiopsis terrae]
MRSRPADTADRDLVRALCPALAGAGTAVLAAGARRGHRSRERAFRALTEEWARQGGPAAGPWFSRTLTRLGRPELAPS